MTTQRTTAVALSNLAFVASVLFAGGCGVLAGPNESACRSATNRIVECALSFSFEDQSDISESQLAEFCAMVPETSECDVWSTFSDALNSASCIELVSDFQRIMNLDNIVIPLNSNGCFPGATSGVSSPDPTPGTSPCEPLTDFELCRLDSSCPEDCLE